MPRGLSGQNEECGLERIFNVERIAKDAPAHRHHHRAVPCDERCEGALIALGGESGQQLSVGSARGAAVGKEPLDLPQSGSKSRT